jgi:hypothetical protein
MPQGHFRLAAIFFERHGHKHFRRPVPLHGVGRRRNHVPLRVRKMICIDKLRLWNDLTIGECPSDEAQTAFALALSSQGNVKTTTLKAFSAKEIPTILNLLKKP